MGLKCGSRTCWCEILEDEREKEVGDLSFAKLSYKVPGMCGALVGGEVEGCLGFIFIFRVPMRRKVPKSMTEGNRA
jgi:hypothetical protein